MDRMVWIRWYGSYGMNHMIWGRCYGSYGIDHIVWVTCYASYDMDHMIWIRMGHIWIHTWDPTWNLVRISLHGTLHGPCMEPCLQHPNLEHSMLDDHNAVHQIMFFSRRQSSCDNNTAFRNDGERGSPDSSRWLPKHASKRRPSPTRWEAALRSADGSTPTAGSAAPLDQATYTGGSQGRKELTRPLTIKPKTMYDDKDDVW